MDWNKIWIFLIALVVVYLLFTSTQQQKDDKEMLQDKINAVGTEIGKLLDAPPHVWVTWRNQLYKQPLSIDELSTYLDRLQDKLTELKIQRGMRY